MNDCQDHESPRQVTFPGRFDSLAEIGDLVAQAAQDAGLDPRAAYAVQLAVDEACSNIIEHAYGGEDRGEIDFTCHIDDGSLTVVLRDTGPPFDPANVPEPDLQARLQDREVGGLGVYFIHNLIDEVHFESVPGTGNVLTLVKRRKEEP